MHAHTHNQSLLLSAVLLTIIALFGCGDEGSVPLQAESNVAADASVDDTSQQTTDDTTELDTDITDTSTQDTSEHSADAGLDGTDSTPLPDVDSPPDAEPDLVFEDDTSPIDEGMGCGMSPPAQDMEWRVTHNGVERSFFVHLPPSYDANTPAPVVLNFHGRALNATLHVDLSQMIEASDAQGFIAIHPEGTGTLQTWNAELCCGHASDNDVDDVGFVETLLDTIEASLCIDTRRVYATGMSNGGFFSHRLACELSDRIAAIAPVAGTLTTFDCAPSRPMPVFHFHGNGDFIVPYDGFAGFISVPATMDTWVELNGCDAQSTTFFEQDDVLCEAWAGCDQDVEVRLCTVDDGGHTWPGGTTSGIFGHLTNTISASEMMLEFFQRYSLPTR